MGKTRLAIICSLMLLAVLSAVGTVVVAAPGKGSAEASTYLGRDLQK